MTDVVTIAKERRRRLQAEIARLDGFLHMADALLKYDEGLKRRQGNGAEPAGPAVLLNELDPARATGHDDTTTGTSAKVTVRSANAKDEAPAGGKPESESGNSDSLDDHFAFGQSARTDDNLVLTDRVSDEDAGVDAFVGQRLRQRRWMLGMTKRQLAEKVGLEVEKINRCELGEARVSTGEMWHIAGALGVPMSYFYEDDDKVAAEPDDKAGEQNQSAENKSEARVAQIA